MPVVYKATNNINGKCYVGVDKNWPHRKAAHKCAVKKGSTLVFHNAIRQYGWKNFSWEILEESGNHQLLLNEREPFYINELNTHYLTGNGYNMTNGGDATMGWVPSEETKIKISEANKGRQAWNKGKPSPWTSKRNKEISGIPQQKLKKEYLIISPKKEVFEIKGLLEFCKENGLHAGNMCSVAKGRLKHYKGWKCEPILT